MDRPVEALYDPRNGDLALHVADFQVAPGARVDADGVSDRGTAERSNYFTICWLQEGSGRIWADLALHLYSAPALLFFSPYQLRRFVPERPTRGVILQFHANFLCIETYHEEVGCNGVLFNDVYGAPIVALDDRSAREVDELVGQIRRELNEGGLAHAEILLSYLKVFLIRATRLKREQQQPRQEGAGIVAGGRLPQELEALRGLIETHYRTLHAPAEYASRLGTDPKALGKLVKTHFHKTLTELIRERILKQAKWDLLHTLKPVKQVAHELGYSDELYFSRLFKRATGRSPLGFRDYETAIRGGRNLSMTSSFPSIPAEPGAPHNGVQPTSE